MCSMLSPSPPAQPASAGRLRLAHNVLSEHAPPTKPCARLRGPRLGCPPGPARTAPPVTFHLSLQTPCCTLFWHTSRGAPSRDSPFSFPRSAPAFFLPSLRPHACEPQPHTTALSLQLHSALGSAIVRPSLPPSFLPPSLAGFALPHVPPSAVCCLPYRLPLPFLWTSHPVRSAHIPTSQLPFGQHSRLSHPPVACVLASGTATLALRSLPTAGESQPPPSFQGPSRLHPFARCLPRPGSSTHTHG